jgi:hypothetical protein
MIARAFEPDLDDADGGDDESRVGESGTAGQASSGTPQTLRSSRVRGVVSVLLVLHLVAIAAAPLAMEPASLPAKQTFAFFRPYLDAAFLNHGYHFFAPEPGPSHLIRYELTFSDGHAESGVFPDPAMHQPRLNYHRHFMLTEFANQLAVSETQQPALDELSRSFARHLMSERDADSATLFLRRHYIPSPMQVQSGTPLDAEELYAERPLGTFLQDEAAPFNGPLDASPPAAQLTGGLGPAVPLRLTGELTAGEVTR